MWGFGDSTWLRIYTVGCKRCSENVLGAMKNRSSNLKWISKHSRGSAIVCQIPHRIWYSPFHSAFLDSQSVSPDSFLFSKEFCRWSAPPSNRSWQMSHLQDPGQSTRSTRLEVKGPEKTALSPWSANQLALQSTSYHELQPERKLAWWNGYCKYHDMQSLKKYAW